MEQGAHPSSETKGPLARKTNSNDFTRDINDRPAQAYDVQEHESELELRNDLLSDDSMVQKVQALMKPLSATQKNKISEKYMAVDRGPLAKLRAPAGVRLSSSGVKPPGALYPHAELRAPAGVRWLTKDLKEGA